MASSPISSWQIDGETVTDFILGGSNLDSKLKSRDITLSTKVCMVKAKVFPVVIDGLWELDHKESWAPKNWCFWTVVLEKTLESPLDCKESQPIHHKGNQSWIVIGRTDADAKAPILWSPDEKNWLIGKDTNAGKDWKAGGEGYRGRDGWMASPTRWTWVWVDSGTWWWTGRTGMLWFTESQRVGYYWATELNWTELNSSQNVGNSD